MTEQYQCPVRNVCPYHYDACYDPKRFCRIIEDTPEHFDLVQRNQGDKP